MYYLRRGIRFGPLTTGIEIVIDISYHHPHVFLLIIN
jgi:hypothetical protein